MSSRRLSGVQKEVLSLYRRVLREAVKKDRAEDSLSSSSPSSVVSLLSSKSSAAAAAAEHDDNNNNTNNTITTSTTFYAAAEFRRQAQTAKRSDFKKIEYMIRKGDKQINLLKMPGVKVVGGI